MAHENETFIKKKQNPSVNKFTLLLLKNSIIILLLTEIAIYLLASCDSLLFPYCH